MFCTCCLLSLASVHSSSLPVSFCLCFCQIQNPQESQFSGLGWLCAPCPRLRAGFQANDQPPRNCPLLHSEIPHSPGSLLPPGRTLLSLFSGFSSLTVFYTGDCPRTQHGAAFSFKFPRDAVSSNPISNARLLLAAVSLAWSPGSHNSKAPWHFRLCVWGSP